MNHNKSYPDHESFTIFVSELAKLEKRYLSKQASIQPTEPQFTNQTLLKHIKYFGTPDQYLDFPSYRRDYYAKAGVSPEKTIKQMCMDYLKSIAWVYEYYVNGLPSWTYYYGWHYAPLMVDLVETMKEIPKQDWISFYQFDKGKPSLPFVQLLCVLPPTSADLLPKPFRSLMTSPKSPLVKSGMYSTDFVIDYEGKIKEHMGIAILPFVNVHEVIKAYEPIAKHLKYKYVRNSVGKNAKFVYDSHYQAKFIGEYGNIDPLYVKKILL
jgi:5'-3' exonuclease